MKRKAVIIYSHDVEGEKLLPGAAVDAENWKNFLLSDLGGAWNDTEIKVLRKPFSSDVSAELNVDKDVYLFVAFSGHGEDGTVVLNETLRSYSIENLRPKTNRGVLICDSCRGVAEYSKLSFGFKQAANQLLVLNASTVRNKAYYQESTLAQYNFYKETVSNYHRDYWISCFGSQIGCVKMLSCSKGEGADEDPEAGGYYTTLLLQAAENISNSARSSVISTRHAHDYAAANLPEQQNPEYSPNHLAYPFAVCVV